MNSLEVFVLGISWVGALALLACVVLIAYIALRELACAVMKRGLFPSALAPALIIAARLRVTKGDKTWVTAHTVMKEIAAAERDCPGFTKHVEELFPKRHTLVD